MHHCINPNGQAVQLNFFLNHLYTLKNFINYFVNWNYIFRTLPLDKYLINKILTLALLKKKKTQNVKFILERFHFSCYFTKIELSLKHKVKLEVNFQSVTMFKEEQRKQSQ